MKAGNPRKGGCLLDFRSDGVCALTVVCGEREANEVGAEQAAPVDDAEGLVAIPGARKGRKRARGVASRLGK